LQNGASRATSATGLETALALDGVDDYVSISADLLNNRSQGTFEALIYLELYHPRGSCVVAKGDNNLTDFNLCVQDDGRVSVGNMGNSSPAIVGNRQILLRVWSRVAFTWDGNFWRLYVNGQLDAQLQSTRIPANSTNPVKLGRHDHIQGPPYFQGRIDEVRFSNVTRSFP
jgi:hypothetical protein